MVIGGDEGPMGAGQQCPGGSSFSATAIAGVGAALAGQLPVYAVTPEKLAAIHKILELPSEHGPGQRPKGAVASWKAACSPLAGALLLVVTSTALAAGHWYHRAHPAKPVRQHAVRLTQVQRRRKEDENEGKGGAGPVALTSEPGRTPAAGEPATAKVRIGRLEYLPGFQDVWVEGIHYNLRGHGKARLCLEYLVAAKAFTPETGRHFLVEIDPHVRKTGDYPKLATVQLKDYFRDARGELPKLRRAIVQAAGKNGKYFLRV